MEAVVGFLFLALYLALGVHGQADAGELIVMGLLISLLVAASGVDIEFFIVPDELTLYGIAGGLLAGFLLPHLHAGSMSWHTFGSVSRFNGLAASAIGAAAGGGIVYFFSLLGSLIFRHEAIGFGDVKLTAMIGAFAGWRMAVAAFVIAPFAGLVYALPLLFFLKRKVMPFSPFLSAGAIVSVLFRNEVCGFLNYFIETFRIMVEVLG